MAGAKRIFPVRRLTSNGLVAWGEVLQAGFEGYVAKDEASPYVGGITKCWLKVKVPGSTDSETGLVVRWTVPRTGSRSVFVPGLHCLHGSVGREDQGSLMLVLEIGGWFIFSCILASFFEHQVHRNLMHRRNFLSAHTAAFKRVFEAHTLLHHKHYAAIFSDEPVAHGEDREIRLTVRKAPIKALPFAALIAPVSGLGAAVFVVVMIFHHWAWNKIHLEMHKPEQRVFSTWPVYKFLARHHCLHHRHLDRNFNVVFPLADYILGTNIRANEADRKYMQQWGL